MPWYAQIIIYLLTISVSFFALWQIDFNKFVRVGHKQFAFFVYIVFSLALGAILGFLFVTIGNQIAQSIPTS